MLDYLHKGMYCTWATQVAKSIWSDFDCSSVQKMNFLWNLKAKKIMLFYGIFANGMFGEVGQKIILSKKSYRKRRQKNCFLIVSGMCCEVKRGKVNTLGALKQHQGLDSSSLKLFVVDLCASSAERSAEKAPRREMRYAPRGMSSKSLQFSSSFFAIFCRFFIGL